MNYVDELYSYIAQTNEAREDLFQNVLNVNPWPISHRNAQQFFKPYDTNRLDHFAIDLSTQLFKEPVFAFIGNVYLFGLAFSSIFYHLYRALITTIGQPLYDDETPLLSCALHVVGGLYCLSLALLDVCYALLVNCTRLFSTISIHLCEQTRQCTNSLT